MRESSEELKKKEKSAGYNKKREKEKSYRQEKGRNPLSVGLGTFTFGVPESRGRAPWAREFLFSQKKGPPQAPKFFFRVF